MIKSGYRPSVLKQDPYLEHLLEEMRRAETSTERALIQAKIDGHLLVAAPSAPRRLGVRR